MDLLRKGRRHIQGTKKGEDEPAGILSRLQVFLIAHIVEQCAENDDLKRGVWCVGLDQFGVVDDALDVVEVVGSIVIGHIGPDVVGHFGNERIVHNEVGRSHDDGNESLTESRFQIFLELKIIPSLGPSSSGGFDSRLWTCLFCQIPTKIEVIG